MSSTTWRLLWMSTPQERGTSQLYTQELTDFSKYARAAAMQEALRKAEKANPRENAPKLGQIRSLGLLGHDEDSKALINAGQKQWSFQVAALNGVWANTAFSDMTEMYISNGTKNCGRSIVRRWYPYDLPTSIIQNPDMALQHALSSNQLSADEDSKHLEAIAFAKRPKFKAWKALSWTSCTSQDQWVEDIAIASQIALMVT